MTPCRFSKFILTTNVENIIKMVIIKFLGVLLQYMIKGFNRINIANKDNIPGENVSYKCGDVKLTIICNIINISALIAFDLNIDWELIRPQPNIVTNNGAARPPKPATIYAINVV